MLLERLKSTFGQHRWLLINAKQDFNQTTLREIRPELIFIPHWSYIISKEIYSNFTCVAFHMTDLPFGRGGSPLQNLIMRGISETMVTAFKVDDGIDTGDIYLKKRLSLLGTAEEIYIRTTSIIYSMILEIIESELKPTPQKGEIVKFKRRTPMESKIPDLKRITDVYDCIRMLDAEGYPKAFIEFGEFKLEFSRASLKADDTILADVRIVKK